MLSMVSVYVIHTLYILIAFCVYLFIVFCASVCACA